MTIDYQIEVEHEGGAELSFRTLRAQELFPNAIVSDSSGRTYVVINAELLPTVEHETGRRYGRVTARPT